MVAVSGPRRWSAVSTSDAARDGEPGGRQIVDQWDADGPNAKETLYELKASLEQLTSALLQTRFQTDASSRSVTRAVSRLRGTLMVCTVVLSLVIIAATLPRFVPITPVGRTWMLWHQVGGTWDPHRGPARAEVNVT